jgi:hypothetical protein
VQHEEGYAKMVTIKHVKGCILADIIALEGIKVQMLKIQKEDYVLWFPKGNKSHLGNFTRKWFRPYKVQYVLPNNIVLLVTIEKFESNLVFVNVNKLKPYKYMEYEVHKQEQKMLVYWEHNASGL